MTTEHAEPVQRELALAIPELSDDLPLLPARMVNEYQYCARLAYLEWVQGEWAESSDTVEGRFQHRRVDKPAGTLPDAADADAGKRIHARSITLSSSRLGLIAKLDLVEGRRGCGHAGALQARQATTCPQKGPTTRNACSSACRG